MNSELVVIVTKAAEKFRTNLAAELPDSEISAMLKAMGLEVSGISYGNGAQRNADFYRNNFGDILGEATVIISGHGIPASELDEMVSAAQSVDLIIGVDPTLMNSPSFVRGKRVVKVQYVDISADGRPDPKGHATKIVSYMGNRSPENTSSPRH